MASRAIIAVLAVLALSSNGGVVEAKKKFKSANEGVDESLFCVSCRAVVDKTAELTEKFSKKIRFREDAVTDALESVCDNKYLNTFTFSPPKMVKGCKLILEMFDEKLESLLYNKKSADEIKNEICEVADVCEGVEIQAPQPMMAGPGEEINISPELQEKADIKRVEL